MGFPNKVNVGGFNWYNPNIVNIIIFLTTTWKVLKSTQSASLLYITYSILFSHYFDMLWSVCAETSCGPTMLFLSSHFVLSGDMPSASMVLQLFYNAEIKGDQQGRIWCSKALLSHSTSEAQLVPLKTV